MELKETVPIIQPDLISNIVESIRAKLPQGALIAEEFHTVVRTNIGAADNAGQKVCIVCSLQQAEIFQELLPQLLAVQQIPELPEQIALFVSPHQLSYDNSRPPVQRGILRQASDIAREFLAFTKIPRFFGFNAVDIQPGYPTLVEQQQPMLQALIERAKIRKEKLGPEGRIVFSLGFFPPETRVQRYDAYKGIGNEFVADWDEIGQLAKESGLEIEGIIFGNTAKNMRNRIIAAAGTLMMTIAARMTGRTIMDFVHPLSRNLVPPIQRAQQGNASETRIHTQEGIDVLVAQGRFLEEIGRPERIIIIAKPKAA